MSLVFGWIGEMNAERIYVGKPLGKCSFVMLKGDMSLALIWMLPFHVRMELPKDCLRWCVLMLAFRFSRHIVCS